MKLSECKMGVVVVDHDGYIGHVVGLTYNISVKLTGNLTPLELQKHTIPEVKFPEGIRAIHHNNLKLYKD